MIGALGWFGLAVAADVALLVTLGLASWRAGRLVRRRRGWLQRAWMGMTASLLGLTARRLVFLSQHVQGHWVPEPSPWWIVADTWLGPVLLVLSLVTLILCVEDRPPEEAP